MDPGFYVNLTSYQNGRTWMDVTYTSGASGVVPALSTLAVQYGLQSLTYSGTGILTAVFKQQAEGLLNFLATVQQASYTKAGACAIKLTGVNLATKTITMLIVDGDGDAVETTTGDIVRLTFEWQIAKNG